MKTCSKCKIEKPLDQFYPHKKGPQGRDSRCKSCRSEASKGKNNAPDYAGVKTCCVCHIEKPKTDFYKEKRAVDGLAGECKLCTSARGKANYAENPEYYHAKGRNWRQNNPEKANAITRAWRKNNPEKCAEYDHDWYVAHKEECRVYDAQRRIDNYEVFLERERASNRKRVAEHCATNKIWREANPHLVRFYAATRRAAKTQRTPPWLTDAQFKVMADIYECAFLMKQMTGEDWHVDHSVPLRGKKVSGLHVPWNLQILPAKENLQKSNRHEP